MEEYRYSLEKGSRKSICHSCHKKKFVRYVDVNTGEYLPEQFGRCDSEINCGYHLNPSADGYAKMIWQQEQGDHSRNWKPSRPLLNPQLKPKREIAFIPVEVLNQTLNGYDQNVFLQNLLRRVPFPFDIKDVERVISEYRLGTVCNGYRTGAITFPFIDSRKKIRAIQVKEFNEANHTIGTDFITSIIEKHYQTKGTELPDWLIEYQKNELKVSCLFGSHLLSKHPMNPIALVEAPKTAIYGTLYFGFPDSIKNFLWLAVYNLSSLNFERCKVLKGRNVYLFPDLSKDGKAFELWNKKAKELSKLMPGTTFKVSRLLEDSAPETERLKGGDLADFLIKLDWRDFRQKDKIEISQTPLTSLPDIEPPPHLQPDPIQIKHELESFEDLIGGVTKKPITTPDKFNTTDFKEWFETIDFPTIAIQLNTELTVYNLKAFVNGRLNHINAFTKYRDGGNRSLFIHQLQQIRDKLMNE